MLPGEGARQTRVALAGGVDSERYRVRSSSGDLLAPMAGMRESELGAGALGEEDDDAIVVRRAG